MRRVLVGLLIWLAMGSAPARAEWLRGESPNFIVYSEESEARLRDRLTQLEHFDRLLRLMTTVDDPPAPNKLHVYIVDGPQALRTIRAVPEGIVGYYIATSYGIAALVDRSAGGQDREIRERAAAETLFHEYVHHFMMQYRANAYPAWYVEGFAEYFMTAQIGNRSIDIGNVSRGRGYSIVEGRWLPIERILFGDTEGLNREQMSQFYAQSWLLVHYFFSTPERQQAVRRYLVEARQGDGAVALQRATGLTPEALNEELRRYIRSGSIRYRRMNLDERQAAPAMSVTRLPAGADDLMLYEAALRVGIAEDQRATALQRIRAAAARHAEDPFARRVLAHAEALFGDGGAADRLLEPLMAAAPNDAELMYIKGMRHLTAAENGDNWESESRAARNWLSRAHRADDNHYQTLYRYAQSLRGEREFGSENTANVLLLAHQLAPQVSEITMNAAGLLISRRQYDEAEALLRPLAADPHNAALAESARRMMDQARRGAAAPAQSTSRSN
jgi:hypothetical protein